MRKLPSAQTRGGCRGGGAAPLFNKICRFRLRGKKRNGTAPAPLCALQREGGEPCLRSCQRGQASARAGACRHAARGVPKNGRRRARHEYREKQRHPRRPLPYALGRRPAGGHALRFFVPPERAVVLSGQPCAVRKALRQGGRVCTAHGQGDGARSLLRCGHDHAHHGKERREGDRRGDRAGGDRGREGQCRAQRRHERGVFLRRRGRCRGKAGARKAAP